MLRILPGCGKTILAATSVSATGKERAAAALFTIPTIIWSFFKDFGEAVVLGAVFVFAFSWFLKARPHNRPKKYSVVVFDVYGKESVIDGIRTEFKTHDVA